MKGLRKKYFKTMPVFNINEYELEEINRKWVDFFGDFPNVFVDQWRIKGDISTFMKDVIVK